MDIEKIQGSTILVIDDIPANLGILSDYLTRVGFKILVKKDGESGLKLAAKRQPDIILLDTMMPGVDGYTTCRRLKASEETRDIPVIFMSALSDTVDKVKGFELGAVDYITKPFQHDEVLARVVAHLHLRHLQKRLEERNVRLQEEIAKRRQTEEKLKSLAKFPDENPNPVLRVAQDGVILYANKAADQCLLTISGSQNDRCLSDELGQIVSDTFRSRTSKTIELKCQERIFSLTIAPIVESGYANLYGFDITERKHAEEALHHQREMAESLREVATILNSSLDLQTVLARILEQMQRVIQHDAAGIFLQEGDELNLIAAYLGNTFDNTNLGRRIPLHSQNPTARVFRQRRSLVIADAHKEPDWVNWPSTEAIRGWMGAPLFVGQEVTGVLTADHFTVDAYTEEDGRILQTFANQAAIAIQNARLFHESQYAKDVAEEAQRAAESANQAKSVFLANMSHELRTPLNAIIGFAQMMTHSPNLDAEERENLNIISRSGEHLLTLINDVLDFSKIEAGRTTLNERNFDLYRLLDDVVDMFRFKAEKKHLQLLFDHPSDLPHYVRADDMKLRQVLMNLLSNAIKFTEEGSVKLRITNNELRIDQSEIRNPKSEIPHSEIRNVKFEIEDTGPGITPEEVDTLFEAFVQTKTGREAQEGTGLGLPISRKFVELMGGEITVTSQIGQGTTFTFAIQVSVVDATDIQPVWTPQHVMALVPDQPRYRLLVVDDKWDNRQLLIRLLEPLGFDIREAQNGQDAIEIWETWQPHLIWMDLRMPVLDGYEATKHIKAEIRNSKSDLQTVIIAVTASSFEEEQAVVLSADCDDFLRKPFRESEVFDLLHKHLDVQFAYEESQMSNIEDVLTPNALAVLPDNLRNELREAVEVADFEMALSLIKQIHERNRPLAWALKELVNSYRFDTLQALFANIQ